MLKAALRGLARMSGRLRGIRKARKLRGAFAKVKGRRALAGMSRQRKAAFASLAKKAKPRRLPSVHDNQPTMAGMPWPPL